MILRIYLLNGDRETKEGFKVEEATGKRKRKRGLGDRFRVKPAAPLVVSLMRSLRG